MGWMVFYINAGTKNSAAVFVASVDPFRVVVWRHVATVAGSVLETQSNHLQASVSSMGTLVPLPTLWHCNEAGIGLPQRSCKAEARYVAQCTLPPRSAFAIHATPTVASATVQTTVRQPLLMAGAPVRTIAIAGSQYRVKTRHRLDRMSRDLQVVALDSTLLLRYILRLF